MPDTGDYGFIDRALHQIAFSHPAFQKTLADLESDLYARDLKQVEVDRPVFVTSLPRAGTTLVLELLYDTGEFSSFTYRQMPFVLSPLLWQKLSAGFQRSREKRERAHGDGMEISYDSPEAFEEVLWLSHLGKRIVGKESLRPIGAADIDDDFRLAFRQLVRKVLLVNPAAREASRYLSKNNANLSRVEAILSVFPDARILVPFRNPLTHVRSLMHQHQRFLKEHASDKFARKYMRWIGHFDFGENFRPIDFEARYAGHFSLEQADTSFWFRYWSSAFRYCLDKLADKVLLLDYDAMLADGERSLTALASRLDLAEPQSLISGASRLREPGSKPVSSADIPAEVVREAEQVHERLKAARL